MELHLPPNKCITDTKTGCGVSNQEHYSLEMRTVSHPKSIVHRSGRAVKDEHGDAAKDENGCLVARDGERCLKQRYSNMSTRSKASKSSASGIVQRFVHMQRDSDHRLDTPYVPMEIHTARTWETKSYRKNQLRSHIGK